MIEVTQPCPTLCDPVGWSPPGSSVHGILQARTLEWVAVPFSSGSSRPRNQTRISWIADRFFTSWATKEVLCAHEESQSLKWILLTFSRWSRMCDTVAVMQSSSCRIFGKYALIRWLMFFKTISRLFNMPCWRPKGRTLDKSKSSTAWMTAEWHSPGETQRSRDSTCNEIWARSYLQL